MSILALVMAAAGLLAGSDEKPRPKGFSAAPSLPPVTREDEDRFDDIIRRFSQADIGALKGEPARKAIKEFEALGPEAIPALIRGLHRAASIKHSCPVLMIFKKLDRLLMRSQDPLLLEFARDELQAGAARGAPHAATVADLRVKLAMRRSALDRMAPPGGDFYEKIPTEGLAQLAHAERGARREAVLKALAGREGREALLAITRYTSSKDPSSAKVARELLERNLARQTPSTIRDALIEKDPEVRKAAVRAAPGRDRELVWSVIDRLADERADVREEARKVMKSLARAGEDFGPSPKASKAEQEEARKKWREWWQKEQGSTSGEK
jgi:HEAT repeat protein